MGMGLPAGRPGRPCPMPGHALRKAPAYSAASTRVLSAKYKSVLRLKKLKLHTYHLKTNREPCPFCLSSTSRFGSGARSGAPPGGFWMPKPPPRSIGRCLAPPCSAWAALQWLSPAAGKQKSPISSAFLPPSCFVRSRSRSTPCCNGAAHALPPGRSLPAAASTIRPDRPRPWPSNPPAPSVPGPSSG